MLSIIVILPDDERRSIERSFQIITALQLQVEARLTARPGVYDGRKNFFTSFNLEFETGSREVSGSIGRQFPDSTCRVFHST
jgi:hypothetical protein